MKEYLLIIRGGDDELQNVSPEEMQEIMGKWNVWMKDLAEKGIMLGGEPLEYEGKTIVDSGTKVIDRPLAEGKELVGGYLMVKAASLDDAVKSAQGCPAFDHGSTIEVRAIMKND